MNIKSLLVGGLLGIASVFVGLGVARADDSRLTFSETLAEYECDSDAWSNESDACAQFVESFDGSESFADPVAVQESMYEACMVIAIHTPGAVR